MSDSVPTDVPLDEQEEALDQRAEGDAGDFDERGEGLDKRGAGTGQTPANPVSGDAGLSSDG